MKILVNTATTFKGGGVQVARSFIEECKNFSEHEYHIILGEMIDRFIDRSHFPENFNFYSIGFRPATRVFSLKSHNHYFKELEKTVKPDVVFTTSGPSYWRPKAPHLVGFNLPHYVYKDSPFFSQISIFKRMKWELKGMVIKYFLLKDADAFVVQTEDVKQRLKGWLKRNRIFTIPNTFSHHYDNPVSVENKLPDKKQDEFRFLTLSAWYSHKNLSVISKVLDVLPKKVKRSVRFVLTLPDEIYKNNFDLKYRGNVINIGPVKPENGPSIYDECDALFLPTLLECFSASYAEAMKMGKPILTSDLGFARTVCGDAALYANPNNPFDISKKIIQLMNDVALRSELVRKGNRQLENFENAKSRAEDYLNICQELVYKDRKIVVVNQAVNYLTIGLCNAFKKQFETVGLITGSIHKQGEGLDEKVRVSFINQWVERPAYKKLMSYLFGCVQIYWLLLIKYRKYEVLFIAIPPMAYLMSIVLPNRCSMLIWDIYPDAFKITGMKESHPIYRVWGKLNRIVFRRAFRLFTIGNRMADLLSNYVDRQKISITPIWSMFQSNGKVDKEENPFVKQEGLQEKFVVQYSGNIGLTHNIEVMVELAELMKEYHDIVFQVIGRGPRVPALKKLVEEKGLPNCQFLPFQSDEMFPYSLSAADLGVVILNELTSKGSIPSKSYNLMSYGIPALYIASDDSELHDYAEKYRHAVCVTSDNLNQSVEFIKELKECKELYKRYSQNAIQAAQNYRRSNADRIIENYLNRDIDKVIHQKRVAKKV